MKTCDKCGKKLGFFERKALYDEYGTEWHLCKDCKKLMFLDDFLRDKKQNMLLKKKNKSLLFLR